ncbi:hypothetical protein Ccrd_008469 [Cynara cardunculus var. scolymus]|uniref:Uncharacterized protein n=1 Tax=Cynara cardunculus var. scolymus TaxID=59895 RepID=A0A103XF52_CYNCS|nr:hypothetical protein Ccrd_008469 [Cynara cardunculus var. scolymus]
MEEAGSSSSTRSHGNSDQEDNLMDEQDSHLKTFYLKINEEQLFYQGKGNSHGGYNFQNSPKENNFLTGL